MKLVRVILVLSILMIVVSAPVQSFADKVFYTGNQLVEGMREYDRAQSGSNGEGLTVGAGGALYWGYVLGVFDGTSSLYALPDVGTKGQIVAIVTKYFKDHPEKWSQSGADLVVEALTEAFPKKGK
jgi:hypothetical protein